ncbi:hypothetical protein [Paraburkholderia sp. C35]|uniref:hypothetical protein n=1 Tax=Paraburkholderia sp. C35 TaxID=2126993 RepID=UPI000D69564D|nr:hypothetical protein [Paraburkholderia sp. C35]
MSVVYTADVFCDGDGCSMWTHGATAADPPTMREARANAAKDRFVRHKGKDYCPSCAKSLGLLPAKTKHD